MGSREYGDWMDPLRHTCETYSFWAHKQARGMNPLSSARQRTGFFKGR